MIQLYINVDEETYRVVSQLEKINGFKMKYDKQNMLYKIFIVKLYVIKKEDLSFGVNPTN